MTLVNINPLVLKNVDLTIGEGSPDQFQKHVSGVVLAPSYSPITWSGLHPDASFTDPGSGTWSCTLRYAQDWETANSLSQYLFDHEGETVPMTFKPRAGSGPTFTADVTIIPGAIGGDVNAYSTAEVVLGMNGRPVAVPFAATPAWAATTVYALGDRVTIDSGTVTLRAALAGTSAASAPVAPDEYGEAVEDGTVIWVRES